MATINNGESWELSVLDSTNKAPFFQYTKQPGILRGITLQATIVVSGSDPVTGQLWPIGTRQN